MRNINAFLKLFQSLTAMLFALTFTASLGGCATTAQRPGVHVAGVLFHNQSRDDITRIRIKADETGGIVECGNIKPGSRCATDFPSRTYLGRHVTVIWRQSGLQWSERNVPINPDMAAAADKPVYLVVTVYDEERIGLKFVY